MTRPVPHGVWIAACTEAAKAKIVGAAYDDYSVWVYPESRLFATLKTNSSVVDLAHHFLGMAISLEHTKVAADELIRRIDALNAAKAEGGVQ